jgi:hypothetical protein
LKRPRLMALLLSTPTFFTTALLAQQTVVEIPFESVPNFLKLPADLYFGEVAGVVVNSKGHVFVFSRGNTTGPAYGASAAQLLEFDRDGSYLREIGKTCTPGPTRTRFVSTRTTMFGRLIRAQT